ncbi:MAG: Ig-like domain-containing protein, partial [Clostridia bacterium]|nr:Ig-like domain-containing protein [Clostridia bacterium]
MVKAAANTLNIGWYSQGGFVLSCASTKLNCNDPVSIAIEPQDTGFYVPEMYVYTGSMTAGTFGLWLTRGEQGKTLTTDYMNDNNKVAAAQKNFGASMWIYNGTKIIYTTKGEDIIAALDPNNRNFRLNHIKLIPVNNPLFEIEANDSKENIILDVESNAEVLISSTTVSGTADINKYEGTNVNYVETAISMPIAGGFVEYKSSDENVATVDATGKITAVGGGTAKIYAQSPDGLVKSNEIEITVTAPSTEDEALTNAFEVNKEELKEYVAPSVVSVSAGGSVITPEKNADGSYDIEAAEENTEGAKFLYWAKGLKANKKIVSFS